MTAHQVREEETAAEVSGPHVVAAAVGVDAAHPPPLVAPVELRGEQGESSKGNACTQKRHKRRRRVAAAKCASLGPRRSALPP